jgi:hypothetical protein
VFEICFIFVMIMDVVLELHILRYTQCTYLNVSNVFVNISSNSVLFVSLTSGECLCCIFQYLCRTYSQKTNKREQFEATDLQLMLTFTGIYT